MGKHESWPGTPGFAFETWEITSPATGTIYSRLSASMGSNCAALLAG
jgi:hypothetical protein